MSIQNDLQEARLKVIQLLETGHIAKVEEIYQGDKLTGVMIHHYSMCPQCVKERNGQERKV
jgi:hypothetical protein